jgi:hypothetical protein
VFCIKQNRPPVVDQSHMDTPLQLLEGINLAWWPTLLRSFWHIPTTELALVGDPQCDLDSFTATLQDFSRLLQSADVDALDEMMLP